MPMISQNSHRESGRIKNLTSFQSHINKNRRNYLIEVRKIILV